MLDEMLVWCSGSRVIWQYVGLADVSPRHLRSTVAPSLGLTWVCTGPSFVHCNVSDVSIDAVFRACTSRAAALVVPKYVEGVLF